MGQQFIHSHGYQTFLPEEDSPVAKKGLIAFNRANVFLRQPKTTSTTTTNKAEGELNDLKDKGSAVRESATSARISLQFTANSCSRCKGKRKRCVFTATKRNNFGKALA